MNEQLAAIRARRAAVTPGVWKASWAWGKSGGIYNAWAEAPFTSGTCLEDVAPQAEADAAFINSAPADIDALLTEVERLTVERDEYARAIISLRETVTIAREEFAALTAERDALAQQLQQAQAQLAGDVVEPILWKAAPPKRHEWDEDAATTPA